MKLPFRVRGLAEDHLQVCEGEGGLSLGHGEVNPYSVLKDTV